MNAMPRDAGKFKTGGILIVFDESKKMSQMLATHLRLTTATKSLIVEALTINGAESYITYVLVTRNGGILTIKTSYEHYKSKIATTSSDLIHLLKECTFECWINELADCAFPDIPLDLLSCMWDCMFFSFVCFIFGGMAGYATCVEACITACQIYVSIELIICAILAFFECGCP